ncbi:MAG: hypothetical protein LIP01_10165 [Tannerellaceae bacterium]|nr:hypothetical protein [Tannerellaceae bacterium]
MKQHKLSIFLLGILALVCITGCNIDAVYYTETVPSTFFDSQENVWQRFYRPFTHWKYYMAEERIRFELTELGTDEICMPKRGEDWSDIDYENRHKHNFSISTKNVDKLWEAITMGVAQAWGTMEDLDEYVDFDAFGFEEGTRESMLSQLRAMAAFYYLEGLDFFGGMPLYSSVNTEIVGRSTDKETFDFIEELLNLAIPHLPVKTELRALGNGSITKATGVALKIRLYFNANSYIGKEMYNEAAVLCKELLAGKYGEYKLEDDWTDVFGFTNKNSSELLWAVPSENTHLQSYDKVVRAIHHYNSSGYFKNSAVQEGYNGICLIPSLKPNGDFYE